MQFMKAHGNTPSPTERPVLAGVLTGIGAGAVSLGLLWCSEGIASVAGSLHLSIWAVSILWLILSASGGALYGRTFRRAANDRHGGWLFGIGFGFLTWMLVSVLGLQPLHGRPIATGRAAVGLLTSHLFYGLILGLAYPGLHHAIQARFRTKTNAPTRGMKLSR